MRPISHRCVLVQACSHHNTDEIKAWRIQLVSSKDLHALHWCWGDCSRSLRIEIRFMWLLSLNTANKRTEAMQDRRAFRVLLKILWNGWRSVYCGMCNVITWLLHNTTIGGCDASIIITQNSTMVSICQECQPSFSENSRYPERMIIS